MIRYQNINKFSKPPQKQIAKRPRKKSHTKSYSGWTNSFNYLAPEIAEPFSEMASYSRQHSLGSSGLTWPGSTPEQLAFLKKVYDINLALKSGRTFVNDVPTNELSTVEGGFKLRYKAAESAIQMLQAIRSAIGASGKDVEAGLTSAYRSASHQFQLWNDYVVNQYYARTKTHREGLEGGAHGEAAAKYLAKYTRGRIATPGYSNHNNGLALDIKNKENGTLLRNKTNKTATTAWRKTWLWDWLVSNAATYHFYQNTQIDEPWHWVYKSPLSTPKNILWTDDLKFQWVNEKLLNKTFLTDESGHNLSLLPFPEWIDTTKFQNDFIAKHGAHANAILGNPSATVTAQYFVIHDTAGTRRVNSSSIPSNARNIHLWLNIDGALQSHDWNYRGNGTKVERRNNGCFVHTELVRHPKLEQAESGIKQAWTYYTDLQYELLAYAYIICSMRKGTFLETTVHREVDRSVEYHTSSGAKRYGHSDPVNFDINKFYSLIDSLLQMPISQLHAPLRDFTYGIEHSRVMAHNQGNRAGYKNEFIPYLESTVNRAHQYGTIKHRTNSAGQRIGGNSVSNNINITRNC